MATGPKTARAPAQSPNPLTSADIIGKIASPTYRLAAPLLQQLLDNDFSDWKITSHRKGDIIASFGEPLGLYLICSGNAHLHIPLSEGVRRLVQGTPLDKGFHHPLVLSEGDLIGEFEVLQGSHSLATVKAGAPIGYPGAPNAKPPTDLLELPANILSANPVMHEVVFRSLSMKLATVNALLRIALSKKRLVSLLPLFFNGALPVLGVCVKDEGGSLVGKKFASGLALGRVPQDQDVRGIEVTANYLEIFGISDYTTRESISGQKTGSKEDYYWRKTAADCHPSFDQMTEQVDAPIESSGIIQFLLRKDLTLAKYLDRYCAQPRSF